MAIPRTVSTVTGEITETASEYLKGKDQIYGFRKAMELVNKTIGHVTIGDPDENGPPVCPDCGETMTKTKAESTSGVELSVWACGCVPEDREDTGK